MAREQRLFEDPDIPAVVRDEAVIVPAGETGYWLLLDDPSVELLAQGICPEDVSRRCFNMTDWKREHYRNEAREKATT